MADFKQSISCRASTSTLQVAQSNATSESNVIVPTLEVSYYAFLDVVEEVDPHQLVDEEETTFTWTSLKNLGVPDPEQLPEGDLKLVMASFDCVLCPYFNGNIDPHRQFYAQVWGKDIDQPHDLGEENWQSPQQTLLHRQINDRFLAFTGLNFISVRLLFLNTPEHRDRFDAIFSGQRWYGLTLSNQGGLPVDVWMHREDEVDEKFTTFQPSIVGIHLVDDVRRHNLEHVISLDFAPDIHVPPAPSTFPPPVLVPVTPSVPISSRLNKRRNEQRDRKFKVKRTNEILNKPWRKKNSVVVMKSGRATTKLRFRRHLITIPIEVL